MKIRIETYRGPVGEVSRTYRTPTGTTFIRVDQGQRERLKTPELVPLPNFLPRRCEMRLPT